MAGSKEDLEDAKVILKLFQDELGIPETSEVPLFSAGSAESRQEYSEHSQTHEAGRMD